MTSRKFPTSYERSNVPSAVASSAVYDVVFREIKWILRYAVFLFLEVGECHKNHVIADLPLTCLPPLHDLRKRISEPG
jgi:hypothetical protein